jgi:NhaP-type Na+/H+ or K+/H+ antiporter
MEKVGVKERRLSPSILMIKKYLKRLIVTNKEAILMQVLAIKGLMQLLMKTRNTDEKWTKEEKKEIKSHLKNIAKIIPAVIIFTLPGGSVLLPILAEALDRRKTRRLIKKEDPGGSV